MTKRSEQKLAEINEQIGKLHAKLKGLEWERNQFLRRVTLTEKELVNLERVEAAIEDLFQKLAPLQDEADFWLHCAVFSPFKVSDTGNDEQDWVIPSLPEEF